MAKRKKNPVLPNGYGSIKFLGKNRRNPYGVYPPVKEFKENGSPVTPKALCYVRDWTIGFAVLTAYKAGTYTPGMEKDIVPELSYNDSDLINRILADYSMISRTGKKEGMIFSEVYNKFYEWKFNGKKQYSKQMKNSTNAAYKNCSSLHDKIYDSITYEDMQNVVDKCGLKHSSLELIVSLLKQMSRFAVANGIIDSTKNTELLRINIEDDDEHGAPFTEKDLKKLWEIKGNYIADTLLIMCYSGYRIGELYVINVDLKNKSFSGGLKTRTSKERIVPIHSSIYEIVNDRMGKYGTIISIKNQYLRNEMYELLKDIGIDRHTPHDCRHTFSALCEKYKVEERDRKRMLGHKMGDITNDTYGHRTLEELREEIEKIKICC